jgi:hypothetical protein
MVLRTAVRLHHINGCRRPPFAIEDLPFHPSPDNISIYERAKIQCIILECRRVMLQRICVLQKYRHTTIHYSNGCHRPPFAIEDLSFRSLTNNISMYERAKIQCIILECRRVVLLRICVLQKYRHTTIHHSNGCRRPPFAIEDLSFQSSTDNISIYERAKNQRVILKYRGVPLLRNLWLPIIEDATIHHSNERRHPIFAIDILSF